MANNYCELSAVLEFPPDKKEQVEKIVDRVIAEIESEDDIV